MVPINDNQASEGIKLCSYLGSSRALKLGRDNLSRARLLPGWRRPRPCCLASGWPWAAAQHSVREPAPEAGDRRAVASGERDGVDTAARLPRRRPRPLPLRARSRRQRESPFFLKRVRRIRSRGTRGRRPAGGKARVQVKSLVQVFDKMLLSGVRRQNASRIPRTSSAVNTEPKQPNLVVTCDL